MKCFFVDNLNISHDSLCIIHNVSFSIRQGQKMALMGPNGGGKTTLLSTLAGLHPSYQGVFGWKKGAEGTLHTLLRKDMAYLSQHTAIDHHFPVTVRQVVEMGLWPTKGLLGSLTQDDNNDIDQALCRVGLLSCQHKTLSNLSGGQFQRMLFARVIVQKALLLLLDEPFAGVDEETIHNLIQLIDEWAQEGKTIIVSLHSRASVLTYFSETLLLAQHFYRWGKTQDVVTSQNLAQAYDAVNLCTR